LKSTFFTVAVAVPELYPVAVAVRVIAASASTVLSAGALREKVVEVVPDKIVAVAVAPESDPPATTRSAPEELLNVIVRSDVGAGSAVIVANWVLSPSLTLLGAVIVSFGTVKLFALTAEPPAVVTEIGPVVTPVGAVAVIEVALSTVYDAAATPLKLTAVAPVKSVPEIVTIVPARPEEGLIPVIVGGVPPVGTVYATERSSIARPWVDPEAGRGCFHRSIT
jgi:hypothetical protein